MMADESDDARDVVRYWRKLEEGWDCVFGSRFMKGGGVIDYPRVKLFLNRLANWFVKVLFRIRLNDTTNAFKAYRREVIEGCLPILAPLQHHRRAATQGDRPRLHLDGDPDHLAKPPHRDRQAQDPRDGQPLFFIVAYVWLEKYFSRGDYRRPDPPSGPAAAEGTP